MSDRSESGSITQLMGRWHESGAHHAYHCAPRLLIQSLGVTTGVSDLPSLDQRVFRNQLVFTIIELSKEWNVLPCMPHH